MLIRSWFLLTSTQKNFRKSELHAEINSLKRQLGSCANTLNSVPYIQSPEPPDPYPIISSLSQAPNSPSLTKNFPSTIDQPSPREGVDGQSPTALDVPIQAQSHDPTKSRTLNDFTVTEIEIDDCFTQWVALILFYCQVDTDHCLQISRTLRLSDSSFGRYGYSK